MNKINSVNRNNFVNSENIKTPKKQSNDSGPEIKDQVNLKNLDNQDNKIPQKWTVLHYANGDSNLWGAIKSNVNNLEKIGSSKDKNIISLLDEGGDNCKIYHIQKDDTPEINSPVLKDLGSSDMSNPKVLEEFLTSMMKKFPSEKYAVIISGHGERWRGAINNEFTNDRMSMPEMKNAFLKAQEKTGKKVDLIGFDACLMANGEAAYELKDSANYLVASEETEGSTGWTYEFLKGPSPKDSKEMAKRIIEENKKDQFTNATTSTIDLTKMEKYAQKTNDFANSILNSNVPPEKLKKIAQETQRFKDYGATDHYHFAQLISENPQIQDDKLKESAKNLMKVIKEDVVIEEQHSQTHPNAHGLTIEIPAETMTDFGYHELQISKDTNWDEAMKKIEDAPN